MANRRIHDLEDTATTLDSGAYIAVDSDSYTAAKKFAADKLPDPTGATDGYVWTADGADGAAWEAVSGGAGDVTDLTTTTGSSTNMVRVAAAGGLEYRTAAQVLSDIGALAATGSVTGATSSAQTFTNGIIGPTWKPASDSTTALQLQTSAGTAVLTVDTSTPGVSINTSLTVTGSGAFTNFSSTSGNLNVYYSRPAGQTAGFFMRTSGVNRWYMYASSAAESGSNAGSDFVLAAYTDAGSLLTDAFYIKRATGNMTMVKKVAIGGYITPSAAQLTVDQQSATGAVPVLLLDQGDDSEEMIEFTGTVGTGNAIEAVGGKTLTTTHFIKCTITGVGYVYIPVGTIA